MNVCLSLSHDGEDGHIHFWVDDFLHWYFLLGLFGFGGFISHVLDDFDVEIGIVLSCLSDVLHSFVVVDDTLVTPVLHYLLNSLIVVLGGDDLGESLFDFWSHGVGVLGFPDVDVVCKEGHKKGFIRVRPCLEVLQSLLGFVFTELILLTFFEDPGGLIDEELPLSVSHGALEGELQEGLVEFIVFRFISSLFNLLEDSFLHDRELVSVGIIDTEFFCLGFREILVGFLVSLD